MNIPPAAGNSLLFWLLAYKASELLFCLGQAGVLKLLRKGTTVRELAQNLALDQSALTAAAVLLKKTGMLVENDGRLTLTAVASEMLAWIVVERELRAWHEQADSLPKGLRGESPGDPLDYLTDPSFFQAYADAMARQSRVIALYVLKVCRPEAGTHLVDLGSADGAVMVQLLARIQDATGTLVDREAMRESAERTIMGTGLQDHVRFVACDLRSSAALRPLVEQAGVTLLLNVAHLLPEPNLDALLDTCGAVMKAGTRLVVYDQFVEPGADTVELPDLLLVDWLMCGTNFCATADVFATRLEKRGFGEVAIRRFPTLAGAFVTARR